MASEANNVTLSTNFNVAPFYDDFDETKNFHRILFRPGLAVQARELTQMQTILQNQIDRFGDCCHRQCVLHLRKTPRSRLPLQQWTEHD